MWADFVAWFQSAAGARVLQTAVVPAIAILVAGVIAALIGRAAVRSAIARADREQAASAVAGLVEAARAAAETQGRRRVGRLRTESDVRVRMLPIRGADLAADWAAARTEELAGRAADGPVEAELRDLRDRLIAWVDRPGRARKLFATAPSASRRAEAPRKAPTVQEPAPPAPEPPAGQADVVEAGSGGTSPTPVEDPAPEPVVAAASPSAGTPSPAPSAASESVPAWRRTRSAERLQQERAATRRQPETESDEEDEAVRTAPVALQRAHRAAGLPATDADDAIGGDAHQAARHARDEDTGLDPAPASAPALTPAESQGPPSWLDQYDDEAQVTQNMNLKTPPPVAATSVRDRTPSGEDIVPRT